MTDNRNLGRKILGTAIAVPTIFLAGKQVKNMIYSQPVEQNQKPAISAEASAEVVDWMKGSTELNMRIAGNILRSFPEKYDALIKSLAENSGYDPEDNDCGGDCIHLEDIARVNLYDDRNIVEIDFFKEDCGGCQELGDSTAYLVTEEDMDYLKSLMGGPTENIMFQRGSQIGGLEDYLVKSNSFEGTADDLRALISSAEEVIFVPNAFCDSPEDYARVVLVYDPEQLGVDSDEVIKEIGLSESLYEELLKGYIIPMEGGY